jgi:hypothetical protein
LADALTLATSLGLHRFKVVNDSTITLASGYTNWTFLGDDWILALGGQAINHVHIEGARVTGIASGSDNQFYDCSFGTTTAPDTKFQRCGFDGTLTMAAAGDYFFVDCYSEVPGTATPIFDHNSLLVNCHYRNWSGGLEVRNLTQGDNSADLDPGTLILASSCTGGTINVRGTGILTDSSAGTTVSNNMGSPGGVVSANLTQVDGVALDSHTSGRVPADATPSDDSVVFTVTNSGHTPTTTAFKITTTPFGDDIPIGRGILWTTSSGLVSHATTCLAWNSTTQVVTVLEMPVAPASGDVGKWV